LVSVTRTSRWTIAASSDVTAARSCVDGQARAAVSALGACAAGGAVGTSVADAASGTLMSATNKADERNCMAEQRTTPLDRRAPRR
jgi:hypothetical protein